MCVRRGEYSSRALFAYILYILPRERTRPTPRAFAYRMICDLFLTVDNCFFFLVLPSRPLHIAKRHDPSRKTTLSTRDAHLSADHDHDHDHDHAHSHAPGKQRILGVIHVIASPAADLEDVRERTVQFLKGRNMEVVVHVEREGDGRCWCGGGSKVS